MKPARHLQRFVITIVASTLLVGMNPNAAKAEVSRLRLAIPDVLIGSSIGDAARHFQEIASARLGLEIQIINEENIPPELYVQSLKNDSLDMAVIFTRYFDQHSNQPIQIFNQPWLFTDLNHDSRFSNTMQLNEEQRWSPGRAGPHQDTNPLPPSTHRSSRSSDCA